MAIRVNKLLSELNMGLATLDSMLDVLGRKEGDLTINTKISDDIAVLVKAFGSRDNDLRCLVEIAVENEVYGSRIVMSEGQVSDTFQVAGFRMSEAPVPVAHGLIEMNKRKNQYE